LGFGLDAESLLSFLPESYQQMARSYINEAQARSMDVARDNALKNLFVKAVEWLAAVLGDLFFD
jgi:hypothetical protein